MASRLKFDTRNTFPSHDKARKAADKALRTLTHGWKADIQSYVHRDHVPKRGRILRYTVTLKKRLRDTDKQAALLILAINGWHFWHPTTSDLQGGTIPLAYEAGHPTPLAAIKAAHRTARRAVNKLTKDLNLIKAEDAL